MIRSGHGCQPIACGRFQRQQCLRALGGTAGQRWGDGQTEVVGGVAVEHASRKAEALLRDPCQHICDVASAVGFASAHHFRHAFKARMGIAPSNWRTRL